MAETKGKVIKVANCTFSCSTPNTPITKCPKFSSFLQRTPVPKVTSPIWKIGVSTRINDDTLTPNQEAITLLSGFATGQIKMSGDVVQHLLTNTTQDELQTIGESLQELENHSPTIKMKIDGSANQNKKAMVAKKEPKTKAKLLVDKDPRTKIPDPEICPENIIVSSPAYVPYKKIPKSQKGRG